MNLPDMTGFEVLSKMNGNGTSAKCPVIVYTGRDLTPEENHELMKYADSVIVKGVKSPERLLDETALFLHRVVADMPKAKQQAIKQLYNGDAQLEGKKIMQQRRKIPAYKSLTDGPGKLTIAMGIDGSQNGSDMISTDNGLYFLKGNTRVNDINIESTARIGIKEGKDRMMRFIAVGL